MLQDQGHIAIFGNGNFEAKEVICALPKNLKYKEIVETHGMLYSNCKTETVLLRAVNQKEIDNLTSTTGRRLQNGKNR